LKETLISLLIDLFLLETIEILDEKFEKFFKILMNQEAFIREKMPFLTIKKQSNFAKITPIFIENKKKYDKKTGIYKEKVLKYIAKIKFAMIPMLLFVTLRKNSKEKPKIVEKCTKIKRKSVFSHDNSFDFFEKKALIIKEIRLLEENSTFSPKNLKEFCENQLINWSELFKMQQKHQEIENLKLIIEKMGQKSLICSICGKQITGKQLKEHSSLCEKRDLIKEKLKEQLNFLQKNQMNWIEQMIRRSKNSITIIKKQVIKLQRKICEKNEGKIVKKPEIFNEKNEGKKPEIFKENNSGFSVKFGDKRGKSQPNLLKHHEFTENRLQTMLDEDFLAKQKENPKKTHFLNEIQETMNKFKVFLKRRELNKHLRMQKALEKGKNLIKILFRLNTQIQNYRSFI